MYHVKHTHEHTAFCQIQASMLTNLLVGHQLHLQEQTSLQDQGPHGRACEFQQAIWRHTPPQQKQWKTVSCLWQSCDIALHVRKSDWRRLHRNMVKDGPSQVVQHVAFKCNKSMEDVKQTVDFDSADATQQGAMQP
jgi:hypothetical protein